MPATARHDTRPSRAEGRAVMRVATAGARRPPAGALRRARGSRLANAQWSGFVIALTVLGLVAASGVVAHAPGALATQLAQSFSSILYRPRPLGAPKDTRTGSTRRYEPSPANQAPILGTPPPRGAPAPTIFGGTRFDIQHKGPVLALAPDHIGLTLRAQPRLYWYLARPEGHHIVLTLTKVGERKPVTSRVWPVPAAGVHAIDLAGLGVSLEVGREYVWRLTLRGDPDASGGDIVTRATIMRVDTATLPPGLDAVPQNAVGARRLALEGIWYDAVDALSVNIADAPDDPEPRLLRAMLLDQADLGLAAAYDRAQVKQK